MSLLIQVEAWPFALWDLPPGVFKAIQTASFSAEFVLLIELIFVLLQLWLVRLS
jgi:hypothetical protein